MKNSIRSTPIFAAVTALVLSLSATLSVRAQPTIDTTTTLAGSSPIVYGNVLNFTATVNPAPPDGEEVDFYENSVLISTGLLTNGAVDLSITNLPVGLYSFDADYEGDSIYIPSSTTTPFSQTITPAPVTISSGLTVDGVVYGTLTGLDAASLSSNSVVLLGILGQDTNSVYLETNGYTAVFTDTNANPAVPVTVVGLTLSGGDYTNYTLVEPSLTGAITPAMLTYVATPASQSYGSANTSFSGTVTGFVYSDTQASATTGALLFTSATTTSSPVASYAINGSGLSASNYTFVQDAGNAAALTVTTATLTYVATPASQSYGTANTSFAGTVTGFVAGDTQATATTGALSFTSATTASSPVASYAINGSGLSAPNYTFVQDPGNAAALTITTATLTYVATPASQSYGSANTSFAGTVTGFVAGDTQASATTGALSFTSATTVSSPVGSYAIGGSGLSALNYNFVQDAGNAAALTITADTVTIVSGLTANDKVYDGTNSATLTLSNTVVLAGLAGGDAGSVTLSTNNYVATFANSNATSNITVTVTGLTLSGGDYTNYTLTQPVLSADITPAPVTISSGLTVDGVVYGTLTGLDAASLSSNNVVLLGVLAQDTNSVYLETNGYTAVFTDTNANPAVPVTVVGLTLSGGDYTNYTLVEPSLTGAITPAMLTYVATPASQSYGSANTSFSGTVTGFVYSDTQASATTGALLFTSATTTSSPVASYAINGSGLSASNYTFVQDAGNAAALTVTTATLTYVATPASQSYGSANTSFAGTVTGFVAGDTQATATTGALSFTSATTASSPVASYAINGSGLSAPNYTFVQDPGNAAALTITTATLTYVATPASQSYGSANTSFAGTVTGFVAGDTQASATTGALLFTSATTVSSPVGSYAIGGSGLSALNYNFVQDAGNAAALTITADTVTIVSGLTANDKVYDGTNSATLTLSNTVVLAGLAGGDAGSVTLSTNNYVATFANSNATSNITVTVTGLTLSGGDYTNYTLTQPVLIADITPAPVTISSGLTVDGVVYGTLTGLDAASLSSNSVVLLGILGQDTNSVYLETNGYTAVFTDTNANPAVPVTVVGLTLSGGDYTNYTLVEPSLTGAITPAMLTYVATPASQSYGSANTSFSGTVTGFVYSDTQASATTGALLFTSATTTSSPVASYAINGSGLSASNYTFVQDAGNAAALTVTTATLTYVATPASQSYGTANTSFAGTVTGFVAGDTQATATTGALSFTSATTASSPVASYAINGSGLSAPNYTFVQDPGNAAALTITTATLTYVATPASQSYGSANTSFAGTVTGFVAGDTQASATTGALSFTSATTVSSPVGSYAIGGSGLSALNYNFVQDAGNAAALTITADTVTIVSGLTANDKVYDGTNSATLTLSNTVVLAGLAGGDAGSVTLSTNNYVATFANSNATSNITVTVTGLTLSGGDYTNYTLTQPVLSADITPAPVTISSGLTVDGVVYGTLTGLDAASLSSNNVVLLGVLAQDTNSVYLETNGYTAVFTDTNANPAVPVTVVGLTLSGGDYTNYTLVEPSLTGAITPAMLTYVATPASQSYGSANTSFSGTVTGFVYSDTQASATTGALLFTSATTTSSPVASYAINGSGLSASNYTFVQDAGNAAALTVTTATLTYVATPASQSYGSANTSFAGTVTGFVAGDTQATATTGALSFTSATTASSPVASYAINGSGLSAPNYTFVQDPGNAAALTITTATLTYVATPASQSYGSANTSFAGTVTGFVAGDTQASATTGALLFTSATTVSSPVGSYAIGGSGLSALNYNFVQDAGNAAALTITADTVTIVSGLTANDKVYDGTNSATLTLSNTVVLAGLAGGDAGSVTLSTNNYVATFANSNATSNITVTVTGLTLSGGDYTNYTLTQPVLIADITPAPVTISSGLTVDGVVYGTLTGLDAASLSSNSVVLLGILGQDTNSVYLETNGYTAVFTDTNANPAVPVTVAGLTLSGGDYTNYTLVEPSLTGAITPAMLTYVATPASQSYGSANTSFSGTVTGFVYSDTQASATTGALLFTSATTTSSPVGSYAIDGSGLTASNYTFVQDAGNATALTITINATPINVSFSVLNNQITLSWPADHLGWTLQTNSMDLSNEGDWFAYPGSTTNTSESITIDPTQVNVYFRLVDQ